MDENSSATTRSEVTFASEGTQCAAWLYRPSAVEKPPVVLMAHGFGALRSFRLPECAARFARAGMAVFLFDYRHFGDSDGSPRHLIHPLRQIDDWYYAIDYVRRRGDVDGSRLALWGTSFSGGHVMQIAAAMPGIKAVVAQVPFLDVREVLRRMGLRLAATAIWRGMLDRVGRMLGLPPRTIPIVARPGQLGCLNTREAGAQYPRLVPAGANWSNACVARSVLVLLKYRPLAVIDQVRCPVLVMLAEDDSLVSADAAEAALARIPAVELVRMPGGHFDVYFGEAFDRAVGHQIRFLRRHLGMREGS